MLEGLEISEVFFSYVEKESNTFRFDDDYFSKSNIENQKLIRKKAYEKLSNLSYLITDFGAFSQMNFVSYEESGVLFLRNQNIKNNLVSTADSVCITDEAYNRLSLKLAEGDVLIPRVGTLGGAAVIQAKHLPCSANQNLAQIKPNLNRINTYFLSTFLCSKFGYSQVLKSATGNVQPWLNLENIGNIEIPLVSKEFQSQIEATVLAAIASTDKANTSYAKAESLLLDALGMANFSSNTEAINVKTFKASFVATGRLDAEYYQPKYEDFERMVVNHPLGFTTIASEYELIKQTSNRDKSAYNYIEIGDINVSDGAASFNCFDVEELPDNAKLEAKRGDLLISKVRPNRGAVAIIDFDDADLIVSGAFTVLREKEVSVFHNETLKVLLRTKMYREWMLKFNIGTQYPVIRDEDILNLPIPCIDEPTQEKIAALVKESFSLKAESERLLDVAKRAVEIAIEQDENAGMAYIESNS